MLEPNEQQVLDVAADLATTLGDNDNHSVAAAAMDTRGRIYSGVNVYHFTGGPCAESVVLGAAATADAGPLMTMVAVGDRGRSVVPPCGRCRQTLLDLHPDCFVIVPTPEGPISTPVRELLPYAYYQPDEQPERIVRFSSQYFDDIVAGRKTRTIRYHDPVDRGPAWFVFEDDHGYRRVRGVVDDVETRRLDALTEDDVARENASSVETLHAGLRRHYPGIRDDAEVEVVSFHLIDDERA